MFGCVGVENPVVIDSLWKGFGGVRCDDEEVEMLELNLEIDTTELSDDEVNSLINELERMSYNLDNYFSDYFKVDYDLPENGEGEKTYKIKVCGEEVPEEIYNNVIDVLSDYRVDYEEV